MRNVDTLITIEAITTAPAPLPRGQIRRLDLKEQAKAVRGLLSDLRIKGVSVTTPAYSMACAINVRMPDLGCRHKSADERAECVGCQMHHDATKRLEVLILAAFPDMDNRTNTITGAYDYRLSVSG